MSKGRMLTLDAWAFTRYMIAMVFADTRENVDESNCPRFLFVPVNIKTSY